MKTAFIIVYTALAIIAAVFVYIWISLPDLSPHYESQYLLSTSGEDKIYFKKIATGITHDYITRVISQHPGFDNMPNNDSDYVFPGSACIPFKRQDDTIIVYVQLAAEKPRFWNSEMTIKQIIVDNPTLQRMLYPIPADTIDVFE
ncbi:MAG: hypothetical protein R3F48_15840 [Candidatus Zixiibacteriota bacterium]